MKRIRDLGADLFLIGSGSPDFARPFREAMEITDVVVYCDEPLRSYALAGLRRDALAFLNPRGALYYARALLDGHRQRRTQGDAAQQGGAMIVLPDGRIPWRFRSELPGHHANPGELLSALEAATT